MIATVDGSTRIAAIRTPADLPVPRHPDRKAVRVLIEDAIDAALRDGERDVHAAHDGNGTRAVTDPSQSAAIHAR